MKLHGVIPALPTPLTSAEDVDTDGLKKLLDHVTEEGAHGVFVLGSMGEGAALLDREKLRAVEPAVKHINGAVPVLAAISEVSTRRTVDMGRRIQDLGPDYLVTTTPYYYKFPNPESIRRFFATLCDELDLPLVFYNAPGASGNPVSLETLDEILRTDGIAAVKDSSGNIHQVMELLRRYPDRDTRPAAILQGDEFVYDLSLLMGADGVVTGGGTVFVRTLVDLYEAAVAGERARAFELQRTFRRDMDEMLGPELLVDWMAAIKGKLAERGLMDRTVTSPFLDRAGE